MGQKVNPISLRLGGIRTWDSRWYARGVKYGELLQSDLDLRRFLLGRLKNAAVSKIVIERLADRQSVTIHAGRPGIVVGKKGADIGKLREDVAKRTGREVALNVVEIRKPELDAVLVAENVAQQLVRRVSYRRAMKRVVQNTLKMGAQGIRINCRGRLGGAEIARMEWYREGRVPLHTLRASIDYGSAVARTTFGVIGVKVWIHKETPPESDVQKGRPESLPTSATAS